MKNFIDLLQGSLKDAQDSGKVLSAHFFDEAKDCDIEALMDEVREYSEVAYSPYRTIYMFIDGSAIERVNGCYRSI